MLQEARIVHRSPGRMRLRIPSQRGKRAYFEDLCKRLESRYPDATVSANPETGAVLLVGGSWTPGEVTDFAREESLFATAPTGIRPVALAAVAPFHRFSGRLDKWTSGEVDLPVLLFLAALGFGVVELVRGNFKSPPWYTAFWYAFGVFSKSIMDRAADNSIPAAAEEDRSDRTSS
jgi:hypothetical protein